MLAEKFQGRKKMKITPFNYAQFYWALPVPIVNEKNEVVSWEMVKVGKYRLATRISKEPEKYDATTTESLSEFQNKFKPFTGKAGEEFKVFVKHYDDTVETLTFNKSQLIKLRRLATRAHWGKDTPEEVQITLQLAVRFGLVTADRLQEYCDSGKVGLDCNGFVGTYMRDVLGLNVNENTMIDYLYKAGRPVKKIEEVNSLNLFVLGLVDRNNQVIPQFSGGSTGHVMITSPTGFSAIGQYGGTFYPAARVVESTGGMGLVESDYLLLSVEKAGNVETGVFNVFRGSKQHKMRVRISRLDS